MGTAHAESRLSSGSRCLSPCLHLLGVRKPAHSSKSLGVLTTFFVFRAHLAFWVTSAFTLNVILFAMAAFATILFDIRWIMSILRQVPGLPRSCI